MKIVIEENKNRLTFFDLNPYEFFQFETNQVKHVCIKLCNNQYFYMYDNIITGCLMTCSDTKNPVFRVEIEEIHIKRTV